jgi:hypothetical protein
MAERGNKTMWEDQRKDGGMKRERKKERGRKDER